MTQSRNEPDHLLSALISDDEQPTPAPNTDGEEDVDGLIDELEALVADGRRMPFRKLLVDEDRLVQIIDRLRTAIPAEVKQAHRVLDEQERILADAKTRATAMLEEKGVLAQIESERSRLLDEAARDAERTRSDADRYARGVLQELDDRVAKLQTSIRNGIQALQPERSEG